MVLKIESYFVEPDDDGGSGVSCDHCGERIQVAQPCIMLDDYRLHKDCADDIVDKLKKEVDKY